MFRSRTAWWPLAALGLGYSATAGAQPAAGTAVAEALFQEGRSLLMAGRVDEACPKFEESQRLDPATGTLMALALCHEQQGKLASAWAEFADVEARSRLDGRSDRERTAREHGAALNPRLSMLTLDVPKDVSDEPRVVITVDGVPIGRAAWNTAIPVDGGEHVVEVTLPDRTPWRATVSVEPEQGRVRLTVHAPAQAATPVVTPPVPALVPEPKPSEAPPATPWGARRTAGIVVLAAGAVGLGVSAWLGLDARGDYQKAVTKCSNDVCPPGPYESAQDARDQGNLATIVAISGGVVALTGVTLWLWPSSSGSADQGARVRVTLGGVSLRGSF